MDRPGKDKYQNLGQRVFIVIQNDQVMQAPRHPALSPGAARRSTRDLLKAGTPDLHIGPRALATDHRSRNVWQHEHPVYCLRTRCMVAWMSHPYHLRVQAKSTRIEPGACGPTTLFRVGRSLPRLSKPVSKHMQSLLWGSPTPKTLRAKLALPALFRPHIRKCDESDPSGTKPSI